MGLLEDIEPHIGHKLNADNMKYFRRGLSRQRTGLPRIPMHVPFFGGMSPSLGGAGAAATARELSARAMTRGGGGSSGRWGRRAVGAGMIGGGALVIHMARSRGRQIPSTYQPTGVYGPAGGMYR